MPTLTLQIDANRRARWSVDDRPIGEPIEVAEPMAGAVDEVGRRFQALFGEETRPVDDPESLRAIGRTLFDAWFAPAWPAIMASPATNGPRELILRSHDPALLDLPWELVELTPGLPIGCDAAWSLRRASTPDASPGKPKPGPLRVLFLAAAPIDQDQLDYEREEDLMLRASADVKGEIIAHFAETGGIDELANLVAECRPHVVHLSGHGDVIKGQGVFCFEDERGRTDLRTAEEIAARVFRGHDVRLAFINGCKTSQAAVSGLCRSLVEAGVPAALGWAASVADDRATDFAAEFYRRLVRGEPTPTAAAAHAREALRRQGQYGHAGQTLQDATFALPQLYGTESAAPFDRAAAPERYVGPKTEYTILVDGIKGLRSGYVGRRREVQRLVPALRQGDKTFAVLTGIGGTGKSTLATRTVNRLQSAGYRAVAVKVVRKPTENAADAGREAVRRLIDALGKAFLLAGRGDLNELITNGKLPLAQRLALAIDGLNESKFVLILDNFEDALDLETLRIADADLAGFLEALARDLVHGSRAIITCRYLPDGTPVDLPNVLHLPLAEFAGHDAVKFLRRDQDGVVRPESTRLPDALLNRLHDALGGTPGLLGQVRPFLHRDNLEALLEELEGGQPGMLADERAAYCAKILTARLYAALTPEAQAVTRRLALSNLPLPIDAAATLAELTEPEVAGPLDQAIAYGLLQRFDDPDHPPLYHPPGLLRPWLAAPERLASDEATTVHARLAAFWRASYEADREAPLRVAFTAELSACRDHAVQAGDVTNHCWANVRIARRLIRTSDWHQARSLLEEIDEKDRDADAMHQLATIDVHQGDYAAAREGFAAALEVRRAIGDRAGEANTMHQLASIDLRQGDYAAARQGFAAALEVTRAIGDRAGEANSMHQLATIDLDQGDYAAAREGFAAALEIKRAIGDRAGEAATMHNLASIDLNQGDHAAARGGFAAALEVSRAIGDRAGEAATMHNLASIDLNQGDHAAAREGFAAALEVKRAIGDRAGEARHILPTRIHCPKDGEGPTRRTVAGRLLADR